METVNLKRMVFKVTSKCTLKCKLCLAYIPYYNKHEDITFAESEKILKRYFEIVDYTGSFTLTGGEPLMNKYLPQITNLLYTSYLKQFGKLVIVTNGTLIPKTEILRQCARFGNDVLFVISNYGPILSKNLEQITSILGEFFIPYRIDDYYNIENYKNGGWLDYRDHSLKHTTNVEVKKQAHDCFFRQGKYYEINQGQLHLCSRSFYRMMKGIIPYNEEQYIDLLNPSQSISEDRKKILLMDNLDFLDSCAYCDGNRPDSPRYKPAEQL